MIKKERKQVRHKIPENALRQIRKKCDALPTRINTVVWHMESLEKDILRHFANLDYRDRKFVIKDLMELRDIFDKLDEDAKLGYSRLTKATERAREGIQKVFDAINDNELYEARKLYDK